MGKGYVESLGDVVRFSQFMEVAAEEMEKMIQLGRNQQDAVKGEYSRQETYLTDARNRAEERCQSKSAKRKEAANWAVVHVKALLDRIEDPHFHRMEQKYSKVCNENSVYSSIDTPEMLLEKLNNGVKEFEKKVRELDDAFVPPAASNVVGAAVRPFRKKLYMEIIQLRDAVFAYSEMLMTCQDVEKERAEYGLALSGRMEVEARRRDEKLRQIPVEINDMLMRLMSVFSEGIARLQQERGIFGQKEIELGTGYFVQEHAEAFRNSILREVSCVTIEKSQISFPVKMDEMKENFFLTHEGTENIGAVFCSMAVEILYACENAEVYFADAVGLGSTYRQLQSLKEFSSVHIWNSEPQVEAGLGEIEKWITDTYEKCLGDKFATIDDFNRTAALKRKKKFIFINEVGANVPQKCFSQMLRIINNGNNAGVYVICAQVLCDYGNDRVLTGFLSDLNQNMIPLNVTNHLAKIGTHTYIALKDQISAKKLASISGRLQTYAEESKVLPIGSALPDENSWQKKSSEKEIVIPFGIDENGRQAIFTLSSERPYGLIIGDVRVGKSSLLHTIIFQTLAKYSPDEVRIGIGDFKDGADFNVYAKGNLKSIDAVVNDEDPDAMLSFLGYYVAEMQKRQRWFEELEDATGRIIQKYENYRETNRSYGNLMPAMPRIIILIDEFQSLFDGSSCAAYMTELVRKGATYGIHVVLSSQRAVSDNPRNGFSSSLKDYFTSRFVFKTPQNAARSMLAERCADTGRENSGIQRSALLKKGQTVYNSYMGQSEADNSVVQCYYASPEVIVAFIEIISAMNGTGSSVLLKRHAKSVSCPRKRDGVLRIGASITLHRDWDYDVDTIHDDTEVSLRAEMLKNMILSGADDRVLRSMLTSLFIWVDRWKRNGARLHIFGYDKDVYQVYGDKPEVFCHKTIQEQLEELARQIEDMSGEFCVNVFMEPDKYSEFAQSVGSIRSNPNVDLLKKVLDRTERHEGVTIAYCRSYKSMRSSMAYFPGYAPIRITAVGDMENLRCAMSDSTHLTGGEFNVPGRDAVKAYYYNKDTEKMGKVILYRPEIIL